MQTTRAKRKLVYDDVDAVKAEKREEQTVVRAIAEQPAEVQQRVALQFRHYISVLRMCHISRAFSQNICSDLLFWVEWARRFANTKSFRTAIELYAFGLETVTGLPFPRVPRIGSLVPVLNNALVARVQAVYDFSIVPSSTPGHRLFVVFAGPSSDEQRAFERLIMPNIVLHCLDGAAEILRRTTIVKDVFPYYGVIDVTNTNIAEFPQVVPPPPHYNPAAARVFDISNLRATMRFGLRDYPDTPSAVRPLCEWWWVVRDAFLQRQDIFKEWPYVLSVPRRFNEQFAYENEQNHEESSILSIPAIRLHLKALRFQMMNGESVVVAPPQQFPPWWEPQPRSTTRQ